MAAPSFPRGDACPQWFVLLGAGGMGTTVSHQASAHHGCSLEEAASLLYPSSYDWSTTAIYFLILDPMKSEREDAVHTDRST